MNTEQLVEPVPNVEYYEGRSESWDWFGRECWWVKAIIWNGGFAGGYLPSCRRLWRWNASSQVIRTDYVNLTCEQLMAIVNQKGGG